jgi:hypothetical protein
MALEKRQGTKKNLIRNDQPRSVYRPVDDLSAFRSLTLIAGPIVGKREQRTLCGHVMDRRCEDFRGPMI